MSIKPMKLVVVGDGSTGKTCLLLSYAHNRFPQGYVPTVFDNYVVQISAGEDTIELGLWDTAGQEEYDRLRPLSYANTSIFLLCFSMVNPISFENITSKWYPEVQHFCSGIPFLLVGTKEDLLKDEDTLEGLKKNGRKPVSIEEAEDLARKIKAVKFISCSAFTGSHLKDTFDEAIKTVLFANNKKGKKNWKREEVFSLLNIKSIL